MPIITWILYAVLTLLGMAVAGGLLIFIASLSAVIGGIALIVFIAGFIVYMLKDMFTKP